MLLKNDLIEYTQPVKRMVRVLWLSPDGKHAMVYDIYTHCPKPELVEIEVLTTALMNHQAKLVKDDPFIIVTDDESLSDAAKAIRDKAWKLIRPLVENEPAIYMADRRWKLVSECMAKFQKTHKTIYTYLNRYWERGQSRNSLLPDYENCGGKGKIRISTSGIKRGRPRKFKTTKETNVTPEIREIFSVATTRYYVTNSKFSMQASYDEMIKDFFFDREIDQETATVIHSHKNDPEKDGMPSIEQYQYWLNKDKNRFYVKRQRLTPRVYDKDMRGLIGTSNQEVWGPGSRFQIDATIADVYVVSRLNRTKIIGRPVLYIVIDVFSRMIVGMYVGLEGPSWVGAMMALANTASDKQVFCKKFGRDIDPDEWPCHYLPATFLGDKGEIAGRAIEHLQTNFNVTVENAAPYRADWKGIVELRFKLIPQKFKPYVHGYIQKDFRARGAHDYRLDAVLDLEQFTAIIIECILYYNNEHQLIDYDKGADQAADNVPLVPRDIWEWGIKNKSGKLRRYSEDAVRFSLMPVAEATVTSTGIKFHGEFYTCKKAIDELWFDRARQERRWKVKISYDPRDGDFIYLHDDDHKLKYHLCTRTERSRALRNLSWWEIGRQHYDEQEVAAKHAPQQQLAAADLSANIQVIVEQALAEKDKNHSESAASQTKNIRSNRAEEKTKNREKEAFRLDQKNAPDRTKTAQIFQFSEQVSDDFSEPDITEIISPNGAE